MKDRQPHLKPVYYYSASVKRGGTSLTNHNACNDQLCPTIHETTTLLVHIVTTTTKCTPPTPTTTRVTPDITVRNQFIITTQTLRTMCTTLATLPIITRVVALVIPITLGLLQDTTSLEGQPRW